MPDSLDDRVQRFLEDKLPEYEFDRRAKRDAMLAVLDEAIMYLEQLPMGVDEQADVNDQSPDDMTAHVGGLAWQRMQQLKAMIQEAK